MPIDYLDYLGKSLVLVMLKASYRFKRINALMRTLVSLPLLNFNTTHLFKMANTIAGLSSFGYEAHKFSVVLGSVLRHHSRRPVELAGRANTQFLRYFPDISAH